MSLCVLRLLLIWMPNNAESICRKVGKKLRQPALHAFIVHCGTKSARIAPSNTLTDSYTRLLPKAQPYLNFMTRTPKCKQYNVTLAKYTVLILWYVVYAILLLCWSTPWFFYMVELYRTISPCWAMPNATTLLIYTLSYYIAEQFPIWIHCRAIPNPNTLLRFTQH